MSPWKRKVPRRLAIVQLPNSGKCKRAAFTLVELLVVIGIIALLISVLLPALQKARSSAVTIKCLANLRSIGQAIQTYTINNKGMLPGPCYQGLRTYYATGTPERFYLSRYLAPYTGSPAVETARNYNKAMVCPALASAAVNLDDATTYNLEKYRVPGSNPVVELRPFGWPAGAGGSGTPAIDPMKVSQIRRPSEQIMIREIDEKNGPTPGAASGGWSTSWGVPTFVLHGRKGDSSIRNRIYFDGHAETALEKP